MDARSNQIAPDWGRDLAKVQEAIDTREDFVRFVQALWADLLEQGASSENPHLDRNLDALAGVTSSLDERPCSLGKPFPD